MRRTGVCVFLLLFCFPQVSLAEKPSSVEPSSKRGAFLALLVPALLQSGQTFIEKFLDKTTEKVIGKVFDEEVNGKGSAKGSSAGEETDSSDNEPAESSPQSVTEPGKDHPNSVNMALLAKVWLVKGNSVRAVDPTTYVFKEGDLIYLEIAVTSPGLMEAYNRTPKGKVTRIGSWTIPGVGSVRIPQDRKSHIEFYDETGEDLLELRFYPCLTGSGKRSLRVRNETGVEPVVAEHLPLCQNRTAGLSDEAPAATRSLRVRQGVEGNTGYAIKTYQTDDESFAKPIVYTMKFRSSRQKE